MIIQVETFSELKQFIDLFKNKVVDLLVIVGGEGVGKSVTVKQMMASKKYLYVSTHLTPLRAFSLLYAHRNQCICIDDIQTLFNSPTMVDLLKQCGETIGEKEIHWHSTRKIDKAMIEKFKTTSNLCIIANKLPKMDENRMALLSRGYVIKFSPNRKEILKKMRQISTIPKIYKKLENWSKYSDKINLRTIVKAEALYNYKKTKKIWDKIIFQDIGIEPKRIEIINLLEKYKTDKERLKHWRWSRKTYYNYKKSVKV